MRTRKWELQKDGVRIAGPVFASNRGGALSRLRDELDCKRLPNASKLVCVEDRKPREYVGPFTISRSVQYHLNGKALALLRKLDTEGAKREALEVTTYLVVDSKGKVVCGRNTMKEAKDKIRQLEAA